MRIAIGVAMASAAFALVGAAQAAADKETGEKDRPARRISYAVRNALSADETLEFEALRKAAAGLEASLDANKADGKLSQEDLKLLRGAIERITRWIWGGSSSADDARTLVYILGKNVFAREFLTAKLRNEELPAAEARGLLRDFRRAMALRHTLAPDVTKEHRKRAKLQNEFNDLLNKYFEFR